MVDRSLEIGINYIDSTGSGELRRDLKALGSRREKVYLALSETGKEPRNPDFRTAGKLLGTLDEALKGAQLEYTDLWRITVYEPGGRHTFDTCCEVMEALEKAKKQGKARFIGISSHDRRWFKMMIEQFPQLEVVLFPFTTMSKAAPKDGLFAALKKCDVGALGIKPFAGGSLFSGDKEEDLRRARLAIRYILHSNTVLPIPGLNNVAEVDNVAQAMAERARAGPAGEGRAPKAQRADVGRPARTLPVAARLAVRLSTAESVNVFISLRETGFHLAERDEYVGEHDNN